MVGTVVVIEIWPTLIRFTAACVLLHAFASDAALLVRVEANPDPARPGDTVNVLVNVSNTGIDALAHVMVEVVVPNEVDAFSAGLVSSGGTCALPIANLCEQAERVSWAIGSLAAGKGITAKPAFFSIDSRNKRAEPRRHDQRTEAWARDDAARCSR